MRATQIKDRARQRMVDLSHTMGSRQAVYLALDNHGVSRYWAAKFMVGERDNPVCSQLDKLTAALDTIESQHG